MLFEKIYPRRRWHCGTLAQPSRPFRPAYPLESCILRPVPREQWHRIDLIVAVNPREEACSVRGDFVNKSHPFSFM